MARVVVVMVALAAPAAGCGLSKASQVAPRVGPTTSAVSTLARCRSAFRLYETRRLTPSKNQPLERCDPQDFALVLAEESSKEPPGYFDDWSAANLPRTCWLLAQNGVDARACNGVGAATFPTGP